MGDISTGASNDIEKATETARAMVTKYGMSDRIGPINYSGGQEVFIGKDMGHAKDFSDATSAEIDEEVHRIISEAYKKTEDILTQYTPKLHEVAQYLIKHEKMNGEVFAAIMAGTYVEKEEKEDEASEQTEESSDSANNNSNSDDE